MVVATGCGGGSSRPLPGCGGRGNSPCTLHLCRFSCRHRYLSFLFHGCPKFVNSEIPFHGSFLGLRFSRTNKNSSNLSSWKFINKNLKTSGTLPHGNMLLT